jgi:hypothetical protein
MKTGHQQKPMACWSSEAVFARLRKVRRSKEGGRNSFWLTNLILREKKRK